MSGKIKFRAWDKENQEWADGHFWMKKVHVDYLLISKPSVMEMFHENYELMQFTGLLDANGKEIYEGDIVDFIDLPAGEEALCTGQVIFEEFGWHFTNSITESSLSCYESQYLCVVGNIYENPELLEGSKC